MTKKKTVVMDEFTSEEAFDAASKIEHLLHTPFFGKPPCDSFAQAWATDEIRAKALEFVRDPHAEFHELSEYTDVDNFWGVGPRGTRDLRFARRSGRSADAPGTLPRDAWSRNPV